MTVVYVVDEVEWVDSVWSTPELAKKRLMETTACGITAWTVDGGPEAEEEVRL